MHFLLKRIILKKSRRQSIFMPHYRKPVIVFNGFVYELETINQLERFIYYFPCNKIDPIWKMQMHALQYKDRQIILS